MCNVTDKVAVLQISYSKTTTMWPQTNMRSRQLSTSFLKKEKNYPIGHVRILAIANHCVYFACATSRSIHGWQQNPCSKSNTCLLLALVTFSLG